MYDPEIGNAENMANDNPKWGDAAEISASLKAWKHYLEEEGLVETQDGLAKVEKLPDSSIVISPVVLHQNEIACS